MAAGLLPVAHRPTPPDDPTSATLHPTLCVDFQTSDDSEADRLHTYVITTPVDGLTCVVKAYSATQASSLALPALEAKGVPDDVVRPLIESGWPDESHIEHVQGDTPTAFVLTE